MAGKQKAATEPDVLDVLGAAPNSTVEKVAEALGVARSTAHKRLAAAIAKGRVQRHAGGRDGRRRLPDRYTAIEAPKPADGREPKAGSGTGPTKGGTPRLRPGEARPARPRPHRRARRPAVQAEFEATRAGWGESGAGR